MKGRVCGVAVCPCTDGASWSIVKGGHELSVEFSVLRCVRKLMQNVVAMPIPAATISAGAPSRDDVARRAFELYCQRGCEDGHDVQDWLQAEQELRKSASTAA